MKESSASVYDFLVHELSTQGKFRVRETGIACGSGQVLHAVDHKGRASILVPLESLSSGQLDWSTKALELHFKELEVDSRLVPYLVLQCVDPKLQDQFGLMSDDILEAIDADPNRALKASLATIDRWRQLFELEYSPLLGPAQLAGIMAELTVLERLSAIHGPKALFAWQGPDGNRHDFVFSSVSVEVKATTNHNNMVVTIHGGKQLLCPDAGELYLHAFQLERTPTGTSVPQQVHKLIESGMPRLDLLGKLAGAGYQDADSESYAGHRFSLLDDKVFRVESDFPRITSETVQPPEILERLTSLSYCVDLGQIAPTSLSLSSLVIIGRDQC